MIKSTIESYLDLLMLPDKELQAHNFPNINHSLLYIWSLCDATCTVTFKSKISLSSIKTKSSYKGGEITRINCGISHYQ